MAVLSSAANGGSATATTQKLASLTWREETVEVETCGRSYWSFLQRSRAIDNKHLGNVSAFTVDVSEDEEVGGPRGVLGKRMAKGFTLGKHGGSRGVSLYQNGGCSCLCPCVMMRKTRESGWSQQVRGGRQQFSAAVGWLPCRC